MPTYLPLTLVPTNMLHTRGREAANLNLNLADIVNVVLQKKIAQRRIRGRLSMCEEGRIFVPTMIESISITVPLFETERICSVFTSVQIGQARRARKGGRSSTYIVV
jgi:hypothetical protein